MKKNLLIAGAAVAALIVIAAIALPFLVDANQFRGTIETHMTGALGRKVTIGDLAVSLFSGGIAVSDITIAEDPAFGSAPFVRAKSVTIGIEWLPLILSRQVRVRSFQLIDPQVTLLSTAAGRWNFSSLGGSAPPGAAAAGGSASMNVSVQKLTMTGGQVIVGIAGSRAKRHQYDAVTLEATNLSYASQFPFRLSVRTPGGGAATVTGNVGPLNAKDVAETPFQAALDVTRLDLAATGFLDPASGLAGLIDLTSNLVFDGRRMTSTGKLTANKMQLVPGGGPSRIAIAIDYETSHDMKTERGVVTRGDVHTGNALAKLSGDYNTAGESTTVRLKLAGDKMPAPDLEAMLPAFGVTLPGGASLPEGTLDVDLAITGPLDGLVTTGTVGLANAKLKGFDLAGKMGAIGALAGLPRASDTLIQLFGATIHMAPDGMRTENVNLIVPAIGTLTGNGTIAPGGAMEYRMIAKVNDSTSLVNTVNRYASLGHPENGIPFKIVGTTANPVFAPDAGAMVDSVIKNPDTLKNAVGFVEGLIKKK
ncbi:MAG: AsmA family protein [Acidobacteriia bacterium]|nr:AsmA family protein [Terriglobia bacterium]